MTAQEVAARVEIAALMAQYNTAGDSGRGEDFAATFSASGVLEGPDMHFEGRDCIASGLSSIAVSVKFVRHCLSTSRVTINGPSSASGRTYFQVLTEVGLDHSGVYIDKFIVEGGVWKIAHRIVSIDFVGEPSRFFPDGLIAG